MRFGITAEIYIWIWTRITYLHKGLHINFRVSSASVYQPNYLGIYKYFIYRENLSILLFKKKVILYECLCVFFHSTKFVFFFLTNKVLRNYQYALSCCISHHKEHWRYCMYVCMLFMYICLVKGYIPSSLRKYMGRNSYKIV